MANAKICKLECAEKTLSPEFGQLTSLDQIISSYKAESNGGQAKDINEIGYFDHERIKGPTNAKQPLRICMNQRILFSVSALVLLGLSMNAQQLLRACKFYREVDGPDYGVVGEVSE